MSYRKGHIKSRISGIKPKTAIFRKLWFWLALLVFSALIFVGYVVLFYSGLQLKSIIVSGNKKVPSSEIEVFVFKEAKRVLFRMGNVEISTASSLLLDTRQLKKTILEEFSSIENVKIKRKLPQTILLEIAERKPLGIFCGPQSSSACFLLDHKGIIFEPVQEFPAEMPVIRRAGEGEDIQIGGRALDDQTMNAISKIRQHIQEELKINIKDFFITSPVRVNITTLGGWKIYFDLTEDIKTQSSKLEALLAEGLSAEDRIALKYIDLRPKGKAIICDNDICAEY